MSQEENHTSDSTTDSAEPEDRGAAEVSRCLASLTLDQFQIMTPGEFETAMTQLLRSLGFQAEQTQLTADGGVGIWAVDSRPMISSRVIVQCKRYDSSVSVGEPPVRELYGLVHALGVTKGIVITTSRFTTGAIRFAERKPLELIDGIGLISLVRNAGVPLRGVSHPDRSRKFGVLMRSYTN